MHFKKIALSVLVLAAFLFSFTDVWAGDNSYKYELRRLTKKAQIYDGGTWDAKIIWYPTFMSGELRRKLAEKYISSHHLGPLEAARWVAAQEEIHGNQWEFYVVLYTKRDYKNFSMYPDSFWQTVLTTEKGNIIEPMSIEQIPIGPYEKLLFTHLNRWSKLYKVSFPKVDLGSHISLTLRSVVGESTISWNLK